MKSSASASARLPIHLTRERAERWALCRTVRDLRLSVARGRPISLPNLLRLYSRRIEAMAVCGEGQEWLGVIYLRRQPFDSPAWHLRHLRH